MYIHSRRKSLPWSGQGMDPTRSCLSKNIEMSLPWQIQQLFWSPPIFPPQIFILGVNCSIPVAPPSKGNMHLEVVPMSTSKNTLLQLSYTLCSTMYNFSLQVAKNDEDFTSNGSPFAKTLLSYLGGDNHSPRPSTSQITLLEW